MCFGRLGGGGGALNSSSESSSSSNGRANDCWLVSGLDEDGFGGVSYGSGCVVGGEGGC